MTYRPFTQTSEAEKYYNNYFIAYLAMQDVQVIKEAPNCYFPDWDYYCGKNDKEFTLELKADLTWHRTGNIYIEVGNRNYNTGIVEPSGISITKAKYFIYLIPNNDVLTAYIWETKKLRAWCENKHTIWAGNGKRSQGILINLQQLVDNVKCKTRDIPCTNPGKYLH